MYKNGVSECEVTPVMLGGHCDDGLETSGCISENAPVSLMATIVLKV